MSENINRVVNAFRGFYSPETGTPLGKPRFELRDGRLALIENPSRRSRLPEPPRQSNGGHPAPGIHDYWYQVMPIRAPGTGFPPFGS